MNEVRREVMTEEQLRELERWVPTGKPNVSDGPLLDVIASHRALAARVQAVERERDDWKKSAQQCNGTYEALHQRVAETQRTTDQLRAEYRLIECINHDLEQQVARLERERDDYK